MKAENPLTPATLHVSPLERLLHVRAQPLLRDLASADHAVLAQCFRERRFKHGEYLLREGEAPGATYAVIDGRVRMRRKGVDVGVYGAREFIGFLGMLSRSDEGQDAVAETDVMALELDIDTLFDICEDHPSILLHIVRSVTRILLQDRKQAPGDSGLNEEIDESAPFPKRELDLVERIFFLRKFNFIRGSFSAIAAVARSVTELRLEEGVRLWNEGDPSSYMVLVVSGVITCAAQNGEKKFRFGPNRAVGPLDATLGTPRWYDAVTERRSVLIRIDMEPLFDLWEDHPDLPLELLSFIAAQVLNFRKGTTP